MATPRILDLATLRGWIANERPHVLLDVLPATIHDQWRIPGSKNACIYEVAFADQVRDLGADPSTPIVVYESGTGFQGGAEACARLAELGFGEVHWFEGGREAWSEAGLDVEGSRAEEPWSKGSVALPATGHYALDLEKSVVLWHGRNAANGHHGRISFQEGWIEVENGLPSAGQAVANMHSIVCDDLQGEMAQGLLRHLATGDFFQSDRFPTATFILDVCRKRDDAAPGRPNIDVEGRMDVRGVTQPIKFPAVFAVAAENGVGLQGGFEWDRTRWGSRYGSGRLYDRLGMHLVNDEITLRVRLVGKR